MSEIVDFKEGLQYPDEVKNAVRYGYEYRIESEKTESSYVKYCLPDPSEAILWLGQAILSGIAFDIIKEISKKFLKQLTKDGEQLDKLTDKILSDEHELEQFYAYVKEFNEDCMAITEKQFAYIREEVVADYCGNESQKIYDKYKRQPTIEEIIRIHREADVYADKVMKPRE